jgi:hypothetical protein
MMVLQIPHTTPPAKVPSAIRVVLIDGIRDLLKKVAPRHIFVEGHGTGGKKRCQAAEEELSGLVWRSRLHHVAPAGAEGRLACGPEGKPIF